MHEGKIIEHGLVFVDPIDIPEKRIVWLKTGDIIVVRSGAYTGDSAIIPNEYADSIAGFDMVLRVKAANPKFIQYALLSKYLKNFQIDLEKMRAAQPHLNAEELGSCYCFLPSNETQRDIASFLDRETARINTLMAKKERLIELLQEKRAALITRIVTKGLEPNAKMKDSGVEWLGEVPKEWKTKRIKSLWQQVDYGISDSLSGNGPIRVLTMGNIQNGEIIMPEEGVISEVEEDLFLKQNDLLFNRTNSRELVAKVGLFRGEIGEKITFASYLVRLRSKEEYFPEFINYLLNSRFVLSIAQSIAYLSINQSNLNPNRYGEIKVPIPEFSEQKSIAKYLDRETAKTDSLIIKVREGIERLNEFRSALISSTVTGKIDVRQELTTATA